MITADKRKTRVRLSFPTGFESGGSPVFSIDTPMDFLPEDIGEFDIAAAKTACALSFSSVSRAMLTANLNALGYGDIEYKTNRPNRDAAGMVIASRAENNLLHTAVVIDGSEGEDWLSNFDIGFSAEHRGFSRAADFAELSLGEYIFTRAIGSQPRFFITGCSRGGAIADILAKRLCERYGSDSVLAYTVASPRVTISRRTARFGCIFNLVRDEDFFTRIPPESWGYSRYGHDIRLKTGENFKALFASISGREYIGFDSSGPIDDILRTLTELAPNPVAYYRRRRDSGGGKLSLYEFMNHIADALSSNDPGNTAEALASAFLSDYADLLTFISSGADIGELSSSAGAAPRCSVTDSHSPAAYAAAIGDLLY